MKVVKYSLIVSERTACFALIALLFAFRWSADAQQDGAKIPRIGYLADFGSPDGSPAKHQLLALRQGLRDLGYIEGKTIRLDYRYPKIIPSRHRNSLPVLCG